MLNDIGLLWKEPWHSVEDAPEIQALLREQLELEMAEGHILGGRRVTAVGRRADNDDVLFLLDDGPELALVHLTWRDGREEEAFYPATTIFADTRAFAAECLKLDVATRAAPTDQPVEQEEAQVAYKPKPPLWRSKNERRASFLFVACGTIMVLITIVLGAVMLEGQFFSVPIGQAEVEVVRLQSGMPPDEGPAVYRHLVRLSDGSLRVFVSQRVHQPGEKLVVTVTRGRLTGRTRLGALYRAVPGSPSSR